MSVEPAVEQRSLEAPAVAGSVGDSVAGEATGATAQLVSGDCPLCHGPDAEPVAVGADLTHQSTGESFLAVCCRGCGLLRLDPRPSAAMRQHHFPASYFESPVSTSPPGQRLVRAAVRLAVRRCRGLPVDARLLEVGYSARMHLEELQVAAPPGWSFEAVTPQPAIARTCQLNGLPVVVGRLDSLEGYGGAYDAVLLLHALEHAEDPGAELGAARRLLRPGGLAFVLASNADSAVARLFRGRHWSGYDFPRHLTLFGGGVLRRLAVEAGFLVERLATVGSPQVWLDSTLNLLQDWSLLKWMATPARRGSAILHGIARPLEGVARLAGRGAWLEAILRRPRAD